MDVATKESVNHVVKFLLVGDSKVGKTALFNRFCDNTFPREHSATIGIDFKHKTTPEGNLRLNLQIWDTNGQEILGSIVSASYNGQWE